MVTKMDHRERANRKNTYVYNVLAEFQKEEATSNSWIDIIMDVKETEWGIYSL